MSMQERWRTPLPSRPRPSRPMPQWMIAATAAGVRVGGDSPPVIPPPPPPEDPDYEVIEVAPATYVNGPPRPPPMGSLRKGTGRHCDLCGGSTPAVKCDLCSGQIFCSSCDDMYHRHPKRQAHVRRIIETSTRPPLPPRGEIGMAPVPPPRSRQKRSTTLFRLPSTGGFLSSIGKERQQDSLSSRKEFSLSEKMGSLRRMMGNRPLPPPPTQSHMSPARNPMMSRSNQQIDIEMSQPSKFHTMREGVGHSSFHHGSDFMSRWRHPSLSNPPPPPSKPPVINGHRRTSVGDMWEQGSTREASLSHNSNVESGGKTWKSNASDGRASPSPWGQPGFVDNGTATLNRRRRSEMSSGWNGGWQRSGMIASASVTDLNAGMGTWAAPGGIMQQTQSMAHLHCPACCVNPGANPWAMPEHWHCGVSHNPAAHGWGGSMMHLWPHHHPPPPPPPPPNVVPPRVHSPEVQPNPEDWSNWEDGKMGTPSELPEQNDKEENEEQDKAPLFIPNFRWSCEHCTFVNKPGTRVCAVCCKTTSVDVEPEGKKSSSKEPKDWSDARSHISKKSEGERLSVKARPKEVQQEMKIPTQMKMNEVPDDQSSQEGSVVTSVKESNRWQSYSPRPRKKVIGEKQNHFRRINNRSPSVERTSSISMEAVVKKVSMGVGTSPPREVRLEKKSSIKGSMTSVGTSPPPQSISTQTYETPPTMKSTSLKKKTSEFGSQCSFGQELPVGGQGSVAPYAGSTRRAPRLRRTLSLTLASKQRETTPNAFLRSQSRHSLCGNTGDQSTPEPPAVPARHRLLSSTSTSSEYYNPSGEADGEWSGADDDRKEKDKVHGLELVRLLREAEQSQFTAEEVEIALKHCGNKVNGTMVDGVKGPLAWLKANWLQMVDTVATLATNFGLERRENTVGTVSNVEAREALKKEGGDVWAAVTHCVESRQRKYAELVSRGNFTREDIVSALSNSQGNVESAFNELSKSQLKPFLMRIWGPPVSGAGDNESGNTALQVHSATSSVEEIDNVVQESKRIASDLKEDGKTTKNDEENSSEERKALDTENTVEKRPSLPNELEEIVIPAVKVNYAGVAEDSKDLENLEDVNINIDKDKEIQIQERKTVEVLEEKSVQFDGCERLARQLLAEGHVNSYERAEIAAILILKEGISQAESLLAVQECNSVDSALSYLRQECLLCTGNYPMHEMVSMLTCVHRCCQGCARLYFTVQIRDRSIEDAVCPFCKEPNFPKKPIKKGVCDIEEAALNYYSNLDILLKAILDSQDHELFLRKLRDRTLANDPNFRWCTKCSSGFFADPRQKRLACPDCKSVTCASCSRPWAKQHEGVSCELFAQWLEENDPATQAAGLARHLAESSEAMLSCPHCNSRFALARGGCMHLTCPQCRHEFCSGCGQTFAMGTQCTEEDRANRGNEEEEEEGLPVAVTLSRGQGGHPCARLGLHAHHPRDCLFYLRDMEVGRLQKLLKDNGVEYNTKNPQSTSEGESLKVGDEHMKCQVQVQREGPAGLIDGFCEEDVPQDHAGLCRLHYIEYLVGVMRRANLDPAPLFDHQEAVAELRRRHVTPPERPKGTTDEEYRLICIEMIQRMIPLKTTVLTKQDK